MIKARVTPENPQANMKSYFETCSNFSWSEVEKEFSQREDGKINIATEAVDRWANDPAKYNIPALIFEKAGKIESFSYLELKEKSCRWAGLLSVHGFKTGDRLLLLLPACPEIYFIMVACARLGVIFSTLYTTLNFEELLWRIQNAEPRGIVTHPDFLERLSPEAMESVKYVFIVETISTGLAQGQIAAEALLEAMPKEFANRWLPEETPLYLLYTSGSTGPPKGVVHAHQDMVGHLITGRYVLDLNEGAILWTDGDPAWVTGTVYGAFAPWLCGATSVVQRDPFSASTWYRTLESHRVSVWYTTPMTLRRLMEAGDDLPGRYDFSHLRHIATVGETLPPDLFYWARQNLNHSPHDTWWMTETGMICIANFASQQIKPGSMGRPVPGIEAAVIDREGKPLPILSLGELALKVGWPSMMRAIWRDEKRYSAYFRNGWFLTGDMAIKDEDGCYYHQGRNDDLIKAGQESIGPYEIEQALCQHPAVKEAAVISQTPGTGQATVKAFVTINRGFTPSVRLNQEIKAFVKTNLHYLVPLTEIAFMDELPKTRSGKLLRRVLRARELGLPIGDPSKLRE
jgi:acetyl-CoA synthetase